MTSLNKSFNILCHVWQPEPVLGEQEGVIGNWRNIGDRSTSRRGVKMGHILLHRSISKFTGSAAIAALPKTGKMHQLDHWSDGTQCLYGWKMCSSVKEKCYQACDWFNSGECSLVGVSTDCIQWKSQVFLQGSHDSPRWTRWLTSLELPITMGPFHTAYGIQSFYKLSQILQSLNGWLHHQWLIKTWHWVCKSHL